MMLKAVGILILLYVITTFLMFSGGVEWGTQECLGMFTVATLVWLVGMVGCAMFKYLDGGKTDVK